MTCDTELKVALHHAALRMRTLIDRKEVSFDGTVLSRLFNTQDCISKIKKRDKFSKSVKTRSNAQFEMRGG